MPEELLQELYRLLGADSFEQAYYEIWRMKKLTEERSAA